MITGQDFDEGPPASLLAGRLARLGPTARAIVALIADGIDAPAALASRIGKSPATVYQHLIRLRAMGLIQT
ncbi:hypothetical protein GCM10027449_15440 [Sinomonas notoginsengisoli]|uniref:ArsR family transcriptional regulator n=1 Tax=Sinomonas notoginsengisoli TaxID=1457311 RepID=UPI00355867DD